MWHSSARCRNFIPEWREVSANAIYNRTGHNRTGARRRAVTTEAGATSPSEGQAGMGQLIKAVLILAVLGFVGLVGYAYLADLTPKKVDVKVPVILHAD